MLTLKWDPTTKCIISIVDTPTDDDDMDFEPSQREVDVDENQSQTQVTSRKRTLEQSEKEAEPTIQHSNPFDNGILSKKVGKSVLYVHVSCYELRVGKLCALILVYSHLWSMQA